MRSNDDIRTRLLSHLPPATELSTYRAQVAATLEKNQRRIRIERVMANLFWIFCAVTATAYIWFSSSGTQFPRAPFLACIFLLLGAVEILKHHVHSVQVELQKEVKQLQVQLVELQLSLEGGRATTR